MILFCVERRVAGLARILFLLLSYATCAIGQTAPSSPAHPWHAPGELGIEADAKCLRRSGLKLDSTRKYSLAELIDLAETYNPETYFAWERARSQAATLGIARSELYPTLTAVALSQTDRREVLSGKRFFRQTGQDFEAVLDLNYTIFDFGGRRGRINAAKAELLAANFAFNDAHRIVIYRVEEAYYRLLNAMGQEDAAQASLSNARAVQQAAEERLNNGMATLPDVLEARSVAAQAEYELQAVLGAEEIAQGDLATALGALPTAKVRVQPLEELPAPESIAFTVDQAINQAFAQRPDLLRQVAEVRAANARVKEARAAFFPSLNFSASPTAQSLYGLQQTLPWGHTAGLAGGLRLSLSWRVFDGGARRNQLAQAEADVHAAEAQVNSTRDQVADQVWTAYSNLHTAIRQSEAAVALLQSASQSYDAALESYKYGLRNLLDVSSAQRTLAQARSANVFARTEVLNALADLAFETGGWVRQNPTRP